MPRDVWAIVSDMHCGSTLGLCPPHGIDLDDGGVYIPSKEQEKLWQCWLDYWMLVAGSVKPGDKLRVILNGDAVDGDHHHTSQIVSKNLAVTQHEIAMGTLQPMRDLKPDSIFLIRGTEAHVGASAQFEERIGKDIGAVRCPQNGTYSWWHLQAESQGILIDAAHHGRIGTRPWTKLTGLSTLVAEIMQAAVTQKVRVPNLAVRSHFHQWGDTADNYECRLIQLAGWQLTTAFIHRIAAGSMPHIGGLIVVCEDGKMQVEKVKFHWKRPAPVTWSEDGGARW